MIKNGVYWQGGGWGCRTDFSAPEELGMQTVLYHVGGCEYKIPEVGDSFFSWLYKTGAPDLLIRCEFVEVHRPASHDPPDAFFGIVKAKAVGTKQDDGSVSWETIPEPPVDVNAHFLERAGK
jgi:hypothetical protein